MARTRLKVCSTPGCPSLVASGRCPTCSAAASRARGTRQQRGYDRNHVVLFRRAVLRRDPVCVMPDCDEPSQHADHWPLSRKQLVAQGMDPNDPKHGRGLCASHHSQETAAHQPGGWNAR